jgi:hypothetical protein
MKRANLAAWTVSGFILAGLEARGADVRDKIPKAIAAPRIDGNLNGPAWNHAAVFSEFKTMKPDFGRPPSEKTIVYLTYDNSSLYVAFRCFDSQPAKIKATLSRRDSAFVDDWVAFCLDAADDHQAAYAFLANPLGIQMDGMLDAKADFDASWDAVWLSAARIVDDGYTVEMAIPIKSLRFRSQSEIKMGFKSARNIPRKSEEVDFPEYDPVKGAALSQFRKIVLSQVKGEQVRELLPYISWGRNSSLEQASGPIMVVNALSVCIECAGKSEWFAAAPFCGSAERERGCAEVVLEWTHRSCGQRWSRCTAGAKDWRTQNEADAKLPNSYPCGRDGYSVCIAANLAGRSVSRGRVGL